MSNTLSCQCTQVSTCEVHYVGHVADVFQCELHLPSPNIKDRDIDTIYVCPRTVTQQQFTQNTVIQNGFHPRVASA